MSLPKTQGLYRIARDIELKYLPNGNAISKIGLVASEKYKDKEETCWIDATAFGKPAEIINQYFQKGDQIYINGKIKHETWEKDGIKQSKHSIVIEGFDFISAKKDSQHQRPQQNQYQQQHQQQKMNGYQPQPQMNQTQYAPTQNDELPF